MKNKKSILITVLVIVGFAVVPLFLDVTTSYIAFLLFLFFCSAVVAQGWNLVGGYAGQISLGQNAFFGLGAYTTAMIWIHDVTKTGYYFDPVTMILSGLVPVILAIIIGIPLLSRLRGDYFALGTMGVGEIIRVVFIKGGTLTNGSAGLRLPSTVFESMTPYYWTGFFLALFSTAVVFFLTRSRVGLALRAIREDETSAASHGIHILKYKILAFAISAFITGICGSLYAYYLFHINPDSVLSIHWSLNPLLMCVIGGAGTIAGPIIGAFFMTLLFSVADIYLVEMHATLAGLLIILTMKFMPQGFIGLTKRKN